MFTKAEGKGVFATANIPTGSIACNYGGNLLNCEEGKNVSEEDSNYLMEFKLNHNTKIIFLHHTLETCFTFGKYINHSLNHSNL